MHALKALFVFISAHSGLRTVLLSDLSAQLSTLKEKPRKLSSSDDSHLRGAILLQVKYCAFNPHSEQLQQLLLE
jgi:hypothetical protein